MGQDYAAATLTRAETQDWQGPVVLDFGANWCSICNATRPHIEAALAAHPQVRHVRVEDGKGFKPGREFGVKLWPTLFFLRDGQEVAKLVRPQSQQEVEAALATLLAPAAP